jgi:hypothetical protein
VTPAKYKAERQARGTQKEVAALLGVSRVTITRREIGDRAISREVWLALCAIPKRKTVKSCKKNDPIFLTKT